MAKFISVLIPDLDRSPWVAVQWGDTLAEVLSNKYYTAGINLSIPKTGQEEFIQSVTITETITQAAGNANVYQLTDNLADFIRLSGTKPRKRFLRSLEKSMKNNEKLSF